jgi:hypothetical protein
MTSQRILRTKSRFLAVLLSAVLLTALAASAQQADTGQPDKVSVALPPLAGIPAQVSPDLLLPRAAFGRVNRPATDAPSLGSLSFLPAVIYPAGYSLQSVAVADVNGDGKPDLIVANKCPSPSTCFEGNVSGTVNVLLGNGDGTFQPPVSYGTGAWNNTQYGAVPNELAVGDVNGDGKPDIVVANDCLSVTCSSGAVSVLLGNGDGTFQEAVTYGSGGVAASSAALGDINGDGKIDIVVANVCLTFDGFDCTGGGVAALLGNGDGTFQPAVSYGSGGIGANSVVVADVNGDGRLDLLVANTGEFFNSGTVGVLLNNGDGAFQPAVSYSAGPTPWAVAVADLNADGHPDLVVADSCWCGADASVGVLLNKGDGTFQPVTTYDSGGQLAFAVAIADVNGDGKLDLLVADDNATPYDSVAGVLLGNGDGTFQPAITFDVGVGAGSIAAADVNGDGWLDMVLASGGAAVLLNNTPRSKTATTTVLQSSLNPSMFGQSITFTALVSSAGGTPPNGEIVTFYNGSTVLGTIPLSSGTASVTTSSLPLGGSTIEAIYTGDAKFGPSSSLQLNQVVIASVTSTSLASSLNPSVYGQKVTWTATVKGAGSQSPTGTVNFQWTSLGSTHFLGTAILNGSGVATLTLANLNADPYQLTAVYKGDANDLGSTSAVLNQVVTQATSTATLSSSPNPATQGQAVTFTAKITSPTVTPTGPVTFTAGKAVLGTAQLSGGKAKFTTSTLALGSTTVTATYYGDSNISESSAAVTQTVDQ